MSKDLKQLKENGFTPAQESLPPPDTLCVLITPTTRTLSILTPEGNWRFMDSGLREETVLAWKIVQN